MQTRRSHATRLGPLSLQMNGAIEIPQHQSSRRVPSPTLSSRPAFTTSTKGNIHADRATNNSTPKRTLSRGKMVPNTYASRFVTEEHDERRNGAQEYEAAKHMVATPRGGTTPRGGLISTPRGGGRKRSLSNSNSFVRGPNGAGGPNSHGLVSLYNQPPHKGNNSSGGGSLSVISSSTAALGLEAYVAEVMGVRMRSMTDLKQRLDELTTIHKREEAAFKEQMGALLAQSEHVRAAHESAEEHYEKLLSKERAERLRAVQLMQRFKAEGSSVMAELREALTTAQSKWQEEVDRNAKLTAQLRRLQSHNTESDGQGNSSSKAASSPANLEGKVATLTALLEEEDAIIVELQQRNKQLEQRAAEANAERQRLASTVAAMNQSSNAVDAEYNDLLSQIRSNKIDTAPTLPNGTAAANTNEQKLQLLNQFAVSVITKLKAEQRQRLLTEEQATKVVEAQEQMIKKLEARLKDAEALPSSITGSFAGGPTQSTNQVSRTADPLSTPSATYAFQSPQRKHQMSYAAEVQATLASQSKNDAEEQRRRAQLDEFLSQVQHIPLNGHVLQAKTTSPTTQSKLEMYRNSPRRAKESVQVNNYVDPHPPTASNASTAESRETSLEADLQQRLAAVTADFQESIQSWSTALKVHSQPIPYEREDIASSSHNNEVDEIDFEPEEQSTAYRAPTQNEISREKISPSGSGPGYNDGGNDDKFLPEERFGHQPSLRHQSEHLTHEVDLESDEYFGPA